ncbi:MAG: BspA family leucine-rich repeat surface protein, partial [Bacilli bacterium]|nr:BspA family leucine-rich repeat surface protein [Bacilli bacterium]
NYNYNSTTTGVNLPNLDSTVTYTVTVHNYQSFDVQGLFEISNNSNSDIIFVLGLESDLDEIIYAESDSTFYIIIRYDPNITVLPNITSDNMTISFSYNGITMFKPGNSVNETMNVISSWSGSGADSITRIARYKGNSIPNSLTDYNIVSTISSEHPIYMWYDDGTIYWYSEAEHIYYNFDAGSMFKELPNVQGIYDMNDIYSIYTENMEFMFYRLGSTASTFDLDLGDNFYTKNVYSMNSMFQGMASYCLTYGGIDLGPNFDTSKVTQMNDMFSHIRVYTIHAPTTFVTTNVVASNNMFYDDTRLVGGAGTQYTPSLVDALYAHIDEGTSNPGYFTNRKTAMFKSGKEVNARMKQFVNSSATYESEDTTIQKILKVPQQPAPQYLISENIVSTPDSQYPIYMWYTPGSSSGWLTNPSIVNWWTEADLVFYNPDSSFFYYNLFALDDITECWFFNSKYVTNMSYMFSHTGYNSTSFTLDLGDRFDTSKVTNMYGMFEYTGRNSTSFTLDLGDKFDTGNVTNMYQMFSNTGYKSTVLTLDLGDKFDTGNVTNMSYMFSNTGYKSTIFTLDLGDKFDTSNVTNMSSMFLSTGSGSTVFTLDLGDKFDTSKVTDMSDMFTNTGYSSTVFTLDLGDKFDTSNVTNMSYMFENTGRNSTVFTLDLGDKFDTSKVTNMYSMFHLTGRNSIVFT